MKQYQDHYFKKAKAENFPARSVYKLQEMDRQFGLLRPGDKVLDLGAAPGSWTLYAAGKVKPGVVIAVDLTPLDLQAIKAPANIESFADDAFEPSMPLRERLESVGPFQVVLSDMAPKTTGVKFTDQARSLDLARQALTLSRFHLIRGGHFVVKIFMGPDAQELQAEMRHLFQKVKTFKPKSSRSESKEIFYVGLGRMEEPEPSTTAEREDLE